MKVNSIAENGYRRESMSWLKTNNLTRLNIGVWSFALLVVATTLLAPPWSTAQSMQKGISVELASTSSAMPVPNADNQDALIITVTDTGRLYFGVDLVTPKTLAEKLKTLPSRDTTLYIKADARAPYASVVKVVDAAHTTGVAGVTLLTIQPKTTQAGTVVFPQGIEMELAQRSSPSTK
jgi:biopolymer transport protein ExbD